MSLIQQTRRVLSLLEDSRSIKSLFVWPTFSITSFLMVSRLARQQIIPKTVIDIGANIGQFAVAAAKLFPGVVIHCFEPNPETARELRKNTSPLSNVSVSTIALGEQKGEVEFHVNSYSPSSSILPLASAHKVAYPSALETAVIKVELSTLDDVLADATLTPPVLLKIDVQGYEARTLMGAAKILEQVQYVLVETSFRPMYEGEALFSEISAIMENHGFEFARPIDFGVAQNNGEIVQIDALFVRSMDQ